MIQLLLHGLKMDPLVSLHYYAPICALINLAILPFTEGLTPFYELARIGPLILVSNAAVAFCLNVAAVFLVGAGSGLVLTLAGVFKDQRSDTRSLSPEDRQIHDRCTTVRKCWVNEAPGDVLSRASV